MSISSYVNKEGKTLWKVYINKRSKVDVKIRVQKTDKDIESKTRAKRREEELLMEASLEIAKLEGSQPTFSEIVDKWEKYRRSCNDILDVTIDDYLSAIKMWCIPILEKPINEINKADIRNIINQLIDEKKSNSFQLKVLNGIKRIYTWAKEEGMFSGGLESITSGIKVSKVEEKVPEVLTGEEIKKLLNEAKQLRHKWYPVWFTATLTGMRSGELFSLEWDDLDFANNKIVVSKSFNKRKREIKSTKAGYFRTIPMNKSLKELFLELKANSKTKFVLPRIREWEMGLQAQELRKFCLMIGIKSVKFHALRACFATHMLNEGVSLTTVMKIAGWKELGTVQKYTRLSGIHERGATDCLERFIPPTINENVVHLSKNG